jgi:hypothetical protein
MGSAQSSYVTNNDNNTKVVSSTKKNRSSKGRNVRGRKSMNSKDTTTNSNNNLYHGSAPHGLRASIVSIPSEQMDHALDVTSVESVHSDDVDHHDSHPTYSYHEVAVDHYDDDEILTDTESSEDGTLL